MNVDQPTHPSGQAELSVSSSPSSLTLMPRFFTVVVTATEYRRAADAHCLGHFTCGIRALRATIEYICKNYCFNEDQLGEYQEQQGLDDDREALLHFCMATRKRIGDDPARILSEMEEEFCNQDGQDSSYARYSFSIFSETLDTEVDALATQVILL